MRIKRRGVSTIIAELLLIVITVSIGTLVYSFASTAFGGFGAGFSNLVQEAGNQLAENVAVEQVFFMNTINASCPVTATCGDLFIRNVGSNTAVVSTIYLTNISSSSPITSSSTPPCPVAPAGSVCFDTWSSAPSYNVPLPLQLPPGTAIMVRFVIGAPVHPGGVYAFTLVTGRGNQFVAYEKR